MKISAWFIILLCCTTMQNLWADCINSSRLTGVNLAGAEFNDNKLPGKVNHDYIYPRKKDVKYLVTHGANSIRLPIRWERIQPSTNGELNESELIQLKKLYQIALDLNICLIIDIHNYGQYYNKTLAKNPQLQLAFSDLWLRLAQALPDAKYIAFDLMNEPIYLPISEWAELAQSTLLKLRAAKSKHFILIAGGRWSGLHDWFNEYNGISNAEAFKTFSDPLNNYAIEMHQYLDKNFSGTHTDCIPANQLDAYFIKTSKWATTNNKKLFLGEFGVANNAQCLAALDQLLLQIKDTPWRGWSYWSAGRWWGNYPLALSLADIHATPQWDILMRYFYRINQTQYPISPPNAPTTPKK
jgi:endoglucanase